jgi:predicted nucleic acid-binding protein
MPRIIIDASVAMAWLFDEGDAAAAIKPVLDKSELVAPWLWRLEVTNVLLIRERRKELTEAQTSRLLRLIDELPIDLVPEPAVRTAAGLAQIARPHQLSSYDAVYLDLAITLNLPLFTRDNNLKAGAKRLGLQLILEHTPRPRR